MMARSDPRRLGLVAVGRGAGHWCGLAAPGPPPASPLERATMESCGSLLGLVEREWSRRRAATRAQNPGACDPHQRPAPLHPRPKRPYPETSRTGFSAGGYREASDEAVSEPRRTVPSVNAHLDALVMPQAASQAGFTPAGARGLSGRALRTRARQGKVASLVCGGLSTAVGLHLRPPNSKTLN